MSSNRRSLAALIGVVLVAMAGFGVFLPIFPFLALHVGAGPSAVTIAMGAYSLGQLIAAPLWGRLSDRIGRKPVLITGLVGAAFSYLVLAHATSIEMMFAARLFSGLMAGQVGAAFAAAADLADDKTRARNMGLLGAAFAFGFIAGPALGAFLAGDEPDAAGFARVCYVACGFALVAALGALLLFDETLPRQSRRPEHFPALSINASELGNAQSRQFRALPGRPGCAEAKPLRLRPGEKTAHTISGSGLAGQPRVRRFALLWSRPALARFVLVMLLMVSAQALIESTFALWSRASFGWGPREVGWTFAGLGIGAALLQGGGAGRAARALGEPRVLQAGLLLFALGMGLAAIAHEIVGAGAAVVSLTLGAGLATPALQSLIAGQAGATERGAVMGLSQSASALGRVIGPLSSGAIFEHVGASAPFAVACVLLLAALATASGAPAVQPAPSS